MAKEKIYQVFVSSTYEDLKEERFAVMNALIEKNCIPVGMEYFPASNLEQFEYIKKLIDEVDYYVLIVAGKYGSIEKTSKKSYTQLEYEYAKCKNVPIVSFVIKSIDVLQANKVETSKTNIKRLDDFRRLVMADKMCKSWSNKDELARYVQNAIDELVESSPREGWIRPRKRRQDDDAFIDGFEIDKEITLHPVLTPFLLYDESDLVKKTTWRQLFLLMGSYLKAPLKKDDYEEVMRKYYIGISQKDIESITEQLICWGYLCQKTEGTYQSGYTDLLYLSEKGWKVYGKVKGYL